MANEDASELMNYALWRLALLQEPTPENMGQVVQAFFHKNQIQEGTALAIELVSRHPDDFGLIMTAAGALFYHTNRYKVVAALLRKAVLLRPDIYLGKMMLGSVLLIQGEFEPACQVFAQAKEQFPNHAAEIDGAFITYLLDCGYAQEALLKAQESLAAGGNSVALLNDKACALLRLNRSEAALEVYGHAVTLFPDVEYIRFGHTVALLKAGHYAEGFAAYFQRPLKIVSVTQKMADLPRLQSGMPVQGKKVLCYQEQGLGDTLNFASFARHLLQCGAEVAMAVPPQLVRLLNVSFPQIKVYSTLDAIPLERFDYGTPIPDLPYLAGVETAADLRLSCPFLKAEAKDILKYKSVSEQRLPKVGLVWAGEARANLTDCLADRRRSLPLADMLEAFGEVNVKFVSLQLGKPRSELHKKPYDVLDPMGSVQDMADTAAVMENLDLIISVDTSVAHLAGGLGRPVWMVSRWDACWRWGDEGDASIWYPTMRIFRSQERSFKPVLAQVGRALQTWRENWRRT